MCAEMANFLDFLFCDPIKRISISFKILQFSSLIEHQKSIETHQFCCTINGKYCILVLFTLNLGTLYSCVSKFMKIHSHIYQLQKYALDRWFLCLEFDSGLQTIPTKYNTSASPFVKINQALLTIYVKSSVQIKR